MLKKLKELCLSLGIFSLIAVPVFVPAVAFADLTATDIADSVCGGTNANVGTATASQCEDSAGDATELRISLRKGHPDLLDHRRLRSRSDDHRRWYQVHHLRWRFGQHLKCQEHDHLRRHRSDHRRPGPDPGALRPEQCE